MSDSNDHFHLLEQKISNAAEAFKQTRKENRALTEENERLRAGAKEKARQHEGQERELVALRREREDVRARIEKLVAQIDALTTAGDAG